MDGVYQGKKSSVSWGINNDKKVEKHCQSGVSALCPPVTSILHSDFSLLKTLTAPVPYRVRQTLLPQVTTEGELTDATSCWVLSAPPWGW